MSSSRFRWPPNLARLLGKISDPKLARMAGMHRGTVAAERRRRGISGYDGRRPAAKWTPEMIALLGTDSDRRVAAELGLSVGAVSRKRRLLHIPPANTPSNPKRPEEWPPEDVALLGTMPDQAVAEVLGITAGRVMWKRQVLGIPAFKPNPKPSNGPPR